MFCFFKINSQSTQPFLDCFSVLFVLDIYCFGEVVHFDFLSTRDAKTLENITLLLILEFQEFSRIALKKLSEIFCPHSHSRISRIFENTSRILKNSQIQPSPGLQVQQGHMSTMPSPYLFLGLWKQGPSPPKLLFSS